MGTILCVTEARDGALRKVSLEAVGAGRRLADALGGTVDALVLAAGPVEGQDGLGPAGADRVLTATHADFGRYAPDGMAATVAALAPNYAAVVFAATATGKDLAPRVAGRLGRALATEVTDLGVEDGAVVVTRPVYAGKALQRVRLAGPQALLSIRPNVFPVVEAGKPGAAEEVEVPAFESRVTVKGVKAPEAAAVDVSEATIIVSGGRGLKEPANFKLLEELAEAIGGAAVGASRAVVDAGWRDHAAQVGQTGKTVSPTLDVAVGTSGAIQHLAGMRTSKVIVAINRDKDAPIFKVADYGVVGDLFEVVPRLTEEIRKLRGQT
jgi:electron transfer flavoprotein alpha subunit